MLNVVNAPIRPVANSFSGSAAQRRADEHPEAQRAKQVHHQGPERKHPRHALADAAVKPEACDRAHPAEQTDTDQVGSANTITLARRTRFVATSTSTNPPTRLAVA